jgi:sugar phosphate isomerase/epimerase
MELTMVKFAVMTFMFEPWWKDGRMTHEQMVAGFGKLGVKGVEPFQTFFVEDPGLVTRYRKATADNGMKVSAVDVICDLVYSNAQEKAKGRADLRRGMDICAALGAEVAHVAGHMPKNGVSMADGRKMIAEGLAAEADFARKNGLTLAVEDFGFTPTLMCKANDMMDVLNLARGAVKLVFDTGNFELAGEHADDNFDMLYASACYVHFKDWRRKTDRKPGDTDIGTDFFGCPLGEGIVPNGKIASMLKTKGYSGWVALEAAAVLADPVATVARDLAVMRRWFA